MIEFIDQVGGKNLKEYSLVITWDGSLRKPSFCFYFLESQYITGIVPSLSMKGSVPTSKTALKAISLIAIQIPQFSLMEVPFKE